MTSARALRTLLKTGLLLIVANLVFGWLQPDYTQLNIYNSLLAGRTRLPYSQNPAESYNVTLTDIDAAFAVHEISRKSDAEFRVVLLGDSSVWGWLLSEEQTLSERINQQAAQVDGRLLHAYNLGYPILNATKDLLFLQQSLNYQPDLIVWLVTLESFLDSVQDEHEIVIQNAEHAHDLFTRLNLRAESLPPLPNEGLMAETIWGQRRPIADWLRLQVYGVAWWATDVDHRNPVFYDPVQLDLFASTELLDGTSQDEWNADLLRLDLLDAGIAIAETQGVPVLVINEPIYISTGANSDLRYNFYYPRWAYDLYRDELARHAAENNWHYIDLWDAFPPEAFTDSPFHLDATATDTLAQQILSFIEEQSPIP